MWNFRYPSRAADKLCEKGGRGSFVEEGATISSPHLAGALGTAPAYPSDGYRHRRKLCEILVGPRRTAALIPDHSPTHSSAFAIGREDSARMISTIASHSGGYRCRL